jgi:hypothetical protein
VPFALTRTRLPNPASAAFERELGRVARLQAERRANPELARALARVGSWQASRLGGTYADLAAQARYADAIAFFKSDLYGAADFGERDADLARAAPVMSRMLPQRVIATVAKAMELNALSLELDRLLLAQMPRADGPFTVVEYCGAYRAMGNRVARERQIQLIGEFGGAIDIYVKNPLLRAALAMMRHPARAAGLTVLQEFLERGFAAFRKMHGATEFLATIDRRERALMDAIFAGADAPFPDPLDDANPAAESATRRGAPAG